MGSLARKQISTLLAFSFTACFTFEIISALSRLRDTVNPEIQLIIVAQCLAGYFFSILFAWYAFAIVGGALAAFFAAVMVFFSGTVASSSVFIWFILEYLALCYLLFRYDVNAENQIAVVSVDKEKYQNEKNDLEIAHKAKGEGISILFEKYSTYYNLRKLAEELATSFSVGNLAEIVARHTAEFIGKGEAGLVAKADASGHLTLIGYRKFARSEWDPSQYQGEDVFDLWVIKNQRRLIVADTQQDFRFDSKEVARHREIRSLIVAPLVHERRVIGTIRVNGKDPDLFSTDDLRLLDTIAVLASSALSNAMLFERTEELAIKDSLTNLYVRRYFFDRLKEEHRRALLTHRPLSILMCDLDHFKSCNDRYGHSIGDLMLVQVAEILRKTADNAIVARYGGEEFSILMPETSKSDSMKIANTIREMVESQPMIIRRERIVMTVSIGAASMPEDALDLEMLVQKADQALYKAKRSGRNRVCSSEP